MRQKSILTRLGRFSRLVYVKLFRINDTPQRIALGLGLGVFMGILPGAGPLAVLFFALLFRVNRAGALLGCLLTNTWLSFVTFLFAIKTGAFLLGLKWEEVRVAFLALIKNFHLADLLNLSILKMLLPVIIGYLVVSIFLALLIYLVTITVLVQFKPKRRTGSN